MADNKRSRDKKADDKDRRQRERELDEARHRADEAEPIQDNATEQLGDLDEVLEAHSYPTTTNELTERYGDYEVETQNGWKTIDEVLASTGNQTYTSATDVRKRILGLIHR
ncbi:DUF5789 family protein [Natronocalculus amylovorans]|uniref:Uncharacterized protein n=1 Tax=Natronocalculus amylovorans TaxID=2917812 RepID=A0AAE3KDD6_9EURY|nr:hypothetical protein [Natronocalculus amylovorans]MCL9818264.1 hypothetical protein [Natronocalculus amylovorans]